MSCSYNITIANDEGSLENNVHYDIEFLDGIFTHLAIVNNPRYERANIVLNSKTEMLVNNNWVTKFDNEGKPYKFNLNENIVDFSNKFSISPKLKDVKDYINKLVANGAKFTTLNPD